MMVTTVLDRPVTTPALAPPRSASARDHVKLKTWLIFLGALAAGLLVTLAAAYDLRPVAGTSIVFVVGYPLALLAHLTLGALVVGGVMDLVHTRVLLRWWQRAGMTVVVVLYAAVVLVADWFVLGVTSTTAQTVWYLVFAGGAAVVGGVAAFLVVSENHLRSSTELGVNLLAGLGGLTVGMVVFALVVVTASVIRLASLSDDSIAVPPVRGITGDYVALGDSYSAGEGLDPFDPYTGTDGDDCHRSSRAYSQWLVFDPNPTNLGGIAQPMHRFAACSGAIVRDVYEGRPKGGGFLEPQVVRGEVHPEVGLVTITMGGNDVLFSRVILHCLEHDGCLADPFGSPATTGQLPIPEENPDDITDQTLPPAPRLVLPDRQDLGGWARAAIGLVDGRVDRLYGDLRTSFPNARIVVIGYPQLVPDRAAPLVPTDCATVLRRLSRAERRELRELTDQLNATLYERAAGHGLEFVSSAEAWAGHEPCGDKGQYTNAVKLVLTPNIVDGGSFHPNEQGHKALARLVACYLNANPAPPDAGGAGATSRPPAPGSEGHPVPCGNGSA
jgi:hypothetical protein